MKNITLLVLLVVLLIYVNKDSFCSFEIERPIVKKIVAIDNFPNNRAIVTSNNELFYCPAVWISFNGIEEGKRFTALWFDEKETAQLIPKP